MHDSPNSTPLQLTVIIPARNEERNLPGCLGSLLAQSDEFFLLGRDWEMVVVDDASTDETHAIGLQAETMHGGVKILSAPHLELGAKERVFTGKTQACWFGAQQAQGKWMLFTDADTLHEPNSLVRALHEADRNQVAMLSYSPQQLVSGFWQRSLMPLIFSELVSVYPPKEINDRAKRLAAANGQFLMVERSAYFAVGGHLAVGRSVLEDVDLAYNLKRARYGIRLRYAPDALSTRMYRGFGDMFEGWSKNLALLFPHALALAAWRTLDIGLLLLPLVLIPLRYLVLWQQAVVVAVWIRTVVRFYTRVARSNFGFVNCAISVFGLPLLIVLLIRSWMNYKLFHQVAWKGREYRVKQ